MKIAKDENNYPTDSLTHRWWARYNLYHTLTLRNWIAEENDTLQDFLEDYENAAMAKLEALGARTATMHPKYNTPDDFNYIENQIKEISATHPIVSVTKKFMTIYLDYARDSFILGGSEPKFDTIARLCVFYNGPSVLTARDILANNSPELIGYDWGDSLCMTGGGGSKTGELKPVPESKQTLQNEHYLLHPNLLKDKLSARITLKEDEQGYVEIYSLQGKKLGIYNVTEGTNQLDLSNLKSGSGIYFYRVWVNRELKNNDKLVILQ